ncbi:MAG: BACON domain-containing protein, partial [Bacteroidales bacterium]|nr:BACON domain-containing protein [Bacteroidales bacterium]
PVMDTVLIAAGELLPIPYEVSVEGADAGSLIVTAGTDGVYSSRLVAGSGPGKGVALVQAPAVFSEGYILLSAVCDGYSAIKMISFKERQITPAADTVTVRMSSGSDTVKVAFSANFEFTVSWSEEWLKMAQDTVSRDTLIFMSTPNTSDTVRTCTVKVSPKDNPNFVCKTFVVKQATESSTTVSYDDSDLSEDFSLVINELDRLTLYAPAAGGEAVIWINSSKSVVKQSRDLDWFTSDLSPDGDFYHKLVVNVKANDSETRRDTAFSDDTDERIKVSVGNIMVAITVIQAPKESGSTGE